MAKSEKTNLYLLSIVGIVAVVGIVVLVLVGGKTSVYMSSETVVGEVTKGIPTTTFQRSFFVVDDSSSADDVLMMTDIVTYLSTEGYTIPGVSLDSEVKISSLENNLLVLVRNEEVVIIKPDSPSARTRSLISYIESFVTSEYGISATNVTYSNATINDLD